MTLMVRNKLFDVFQTMRKSQRYCEAASRLAIDYNINSYLEIRTSNLGTPKLE